ncbi:MAG TPA: hypothetical protein VFI47_00465 [Acidimicrobiales bacterium]|nr:hypothetical protein [Acidimicrobiales bacterium]
MKGGAGTTVVATALALVLARRDPAGAVLADLAGDVPAVLGVPEPSSPGLTGWLAAGVDVPADALRRIEVEASPGLGLLPRGEGDLVPGRGPVLAQLLDHSPRPTVVDCGRADTPVAAEVISRARRSLLVTRPCYLALRRARYAPLRPTGVIVVREPGQVLSSDDVAQVVGAPVVTEVACDPAVARAVDAGLLVSRLPRSLVRALADAA